MSRKRLGTAQTLAIEFVAGGRIWVMALYRTPSMIGWGISLCLSQDSSPAHLLGAVLVIKVHGGESSCANPPQDERIRLRAPHNRKGYMLAPTHKLAEPSGFVRLYWKLNDWLINEMNTRYLDCAGTLHVQMEITLA